MVSRAPRKPFYQVSNSSKTSLRRARRGKNQCSAIGFLDPHVSGLPSAQDGPGGLPDRPKRAQSSSKMSQEASKIASEKAQEGAQTGHNAPREPRAGPRWRPERPKTVSRLPQHGPERPSRRRRRPQDGPRGLTTAQKTLKGPP